jgi:hypothetical protein
MKKILSGATVMLSLGLMAAFGDATAIPGSSV